jgi:YD repeat-containing protein
MPFALVRLCDPRKKGEQSRWITSHHAHALHDANYNVLGVVDKDGNMVERYEYTPYGERTVFFSAGTDVPDCHASGFMSRVRMSGSSVEDHPDGICPIGHQGLMHDGGITESRV